MWSLSTHVYEHIPIWVMYNTQTYPLSLLAYFSKPEIVFFSQSNFFLLTSCIHFKTDINICNTVSGKAHTCTYFRVCSDVQPDLSSNLYSAADFRFIAFSYRVRLFILRLTNDEV